jgi:multidrug resistance efflux pump
MPLDPESPSLLARNLARAESSQAVIWLAVVLVFVLILAGVVFWLRKRLSPNEDFGGENFTLGDLRRLHKEGKLSTEEFERAKSGLIAAAHASAARKQEEQKNVKEWGWDAPSKE